MRKTITLTKTPTKTHLKRANTLTKTWKKMDMEMTASIGNTVHMSMVLLIDNCLVRQ